MWWIYYCTQWICMKNTYCTLTYLFVCPSSSYLLLVFLLLLTQFIENITITDILIMLTKRHIDKQQYRDMNTKDSRCIHLFLRHKFRITSILLRHFCSLLGIPLESNDETESTHSYTCCSYDTHGCI